MLTPPPTPSDLRPWTPEATPTAAETDARFAQYAKAAQEEDEEEEEEERMPNLQKDDMLARRTGAFSRRAAPYNHFLPLPASKRGTQGEVQTDTAPRSRKAVRAEWERRADPRWALCVGPLSDRGSHTGVVDLNNHLSVCRI